MSLTVGRGRASKHKQQQQWQRGQGGGTARAHHAAPVPARGCAGHGDSHEFRADVRGGAPRPRPARLVLFADDGEGGAAVLPFRSSGGLRHPHPRLPLWHRRGQRARRPRLLEYGGGGHQATPAERAAWHLGDGALHPRRIGSLGRRCCWDVDGLAAAR
eukprot:scaffold1983_cov376-Prasinococcus_capsulatus_cf.AAC.4